MQDIDQDQLPRETISRTKDRNGDLIARYFEVLVDAPFAVRRKKIISKHIEVRDDNMHRQNTSPVVLIGRPVYGFLVLHTPLKALLSSVTYCYHRLLISVKPSLGLHWPIWSYSTKQTFLFYRQNETIYDRPPWETPLYRDSQRSLIHVTLNGRVVC